MFSANSYPKSHDNTHGYWRRWILLPFHVKIPVERQDPRLSEKLTTPIELSGILNLALEGLRRLEARGHFPETAGMRQAMHEYQAQADSIVAFLDPEEEQCVLRADAEAGKEALYQRYTEWCEKAGRAPVSRTKFNRKMAELGGISEIRPGGGARVWRGVGILD
jgi:putative DNA primase/helicase